MPPRPVEIIGGGLAGLALGLALRRRSVPVTLHEAGSYPRAKVCGEFIAGLDRGTIHRLQLAPLLAGHQSHHEATWHARNRQLFRLRLPAPAIGVSRQCVDTELARAFRAAGGDLRERSRAPLEEHRPGRVRAHGRRRQGGGWTGLKFHVRGLALEGDLEMHLGNRAYVGLAGVEDGRVNVCGLFAARPVPGGPREEAFARHLHAAGLTTLAARLAAADICEDSHAAVAGLRFGRTPAAEGDDLAIGDSFAAIPPFTGHGMAMAFQGAAAALEPILAWSDGRGEWAATRARVRRQLHRCFALRLTAARLLHPWLLAPRGQALMARLHARRALPLRTLYHALH